MFTLFDDGFVIIDLETTGLNDDPKVDIVEIAVVSHHGEILLNTLVKPTHSIPLVASRIHGIYDKDVVDAPSFEDIYPQLETFLNGKIVVAYNHTFEQDILRAVCRRTKKPQFTPMEWYCAMRSYSVYKGVTRFQKLTAACQREGIPLANAHRALGDCLMTLALLKKMATAA
ncbi:MAG: 3'-5' exonuclease [Anaerolineales bacterium]|nr:3'-5' exonuclease [Anaerolineales bacterium]